ncbi:hypothetical protein JX265_006578 [Neoarthrinium moseri]|uniref:Ubiquitin-like domain-containing protein n=1 Tax=Neoarthrinium moseri TaxID=1658444 RepID=A0A9P9WLZ0_9PEZI|nr:hypothetical protein JX265_006578 [Neoarthrinium moseri]
MTGLKPPSLLTSSSPPALSPSGAPPLSLTIRFSASVPDLDLDIPHPSQTTVISLKHLIRGRLAEPNSQRRLRFIQGGKILPDNAALSSVLRAPPPPPPAAAGGAASSRAAGADHHHARGKGKNVPNRPPLQRIYVNCSIGDSLTDAELEAEAEAASVPVSEQPPSPQPPVRSPLAPGTPVPLGAPGTTSAAPRGFDRLVAAGFSAAEVNQLRLQFRSIHSARFTPDTLPSPDSFRRMEDAWIDDNGAAAVPTTTGGMGMATAGAGGGFESDESGLMGSIDAMVWGMLVGFMWPLGSSSWLAREPGMHSDRWKIMVVAGVFLSLLIGIVRGISGER